MSQPHIEQVDERDSSWEDGHPRFRVYLHHTGDDPSLLGWATDTYDITGADILQVIDWAQRQAAGTLVYSIALVNDDTDRERLNPGRGRGLVWLVGMDGNDNPWTEEERATKQRMLARRREPVRLSAPDLMPPAVPDPYNDGTQSR